MQKTSYRNFDSPIGTLGLAARDGALIGIRFGPVDESGEDSALDIACVQLSEYFAGIRREFSVPLDLTGTDFQKRVWRAVMAIPYGKTRAYSEIALDIASPNASRAVGMANHVNPIPIIVPCHRVVGKNGTLTGYGGGLDIKKFLLKLELADIT